MSDSGQSEDERRIAELLRVNADLAAEIRDLALGRRTKPRSSQMPVARRLAKLEAERERLEGERDSISAALDASREEHEELRQHTEALAAQVKDRAQHIDELSHEVARLRAGAAGILRRARARLLRL